MPSDILAEPETGASATIGCIDCDLHPALPGLKALLPYLSDYWREQITMRGIDAMDLALYAPRHPLSARPDWRLPDGRKPGTDLGALQRDALDAFGIDLAICNVLYGAQIVMNQHFGAALCTAINDWLAAEWLDADKRLRGSIVVPMQDPEKAVEEIERRANDRRFVQVLLPSAADMPLGRRPYWPIYAAAEKYGLPVGIHAARTDRFAPTCVGWPSYLIEDHAALAANMQGQLLSLLCEGVFSQHPKLKVVLLESGVTWLPSFMWRADTTWRALRMEMPWVDRSPIEIVREHVRVTVQPLDAPALARDGRDPLPAILEQLGAPEMLLFATDYPHWQFEGDAALPSGLPADFVRRIKSENPLATYPRLKEAVA